MKTDIIEPSDGLQGNRAYLRPNEGAKDFESVEDTPASAGKRKS